MYKRQSVRQADPQPGPQEPLRAGGAARVAAAYLRPFRNEGRSMSDRPGGRGSPPCQRSVPPGEQSVDMVANHVLQADQTLIVPRFGKVVDTRQRRGQRHQREAAPAAPAAGQLDAQTVSYTHLDVYKRQLKICYAHFVH